MLATDPAAVHFGENDDRLFGFHHRPAAGAERPVGVVICNPIGDDYVRAHRTLRHLAERLARAGFHVLRFDFHGTGDSSGDERDRDRVATWRADVVRAVHALRARAGVERVSLVGLRLGATFAADAATSIDGVESLVLWGPYASGDAFVAESTRMHKMHRMLEPHSFAAGPARHDDGEEALGFFLSNETIEALGSIFLRKLARAPAKRALLIGMGNTPQEQPLIDHLTSVGTSVTYQHMPGHKFLISIPHRSTVPTPVLEAIASWLEERHPPSARPAGRPQAGAPADARVVARSGGGAPPLEEIPVRFAGSRRLFGILTRPAAPPRDPDRPCVVMLNAGCVHRIGPHRLFVRMARTWAEQGMYVLRMDLSGIGDSPAGEGCEENLCYPKSGVDDCQQAMTFLESEIGAGRFILTGLCSGADIAFQVGYADDRVAGVVMMNPRTFCVHDLSMVEKYKDARYYQSSLLRPESWWKLLRGEVDVGRVVRMMAPKAKNEAMRQVEKLLARVKPGAPPEEQRTDVPECLRRMAERGVDTFLVATEKDPGVDYVDVHFAGSMKSLAGLRNYRRMDLVGTDHTFTSVHSQAHVCGAITDHLVSRHLAR